MTPDPPHGDRAARAVRGVLAASLATLVALAGHLLGGGGSPPLVVVVAALVLGWPAAVVLAGPRPRLWRQVLTIALAQLVLHGTFVLAAGAAPSTGGATSTGTMPGMGAMPGMGGTSGMGGTGASPSAGAAGAAVTTGRLPEAAMWLGHALAWLLTVAAWRWGDRVAGRLVDLGAGALARVTVLLTPARPAAPARTGAPRAGRAPARLGETVLLRHPRRGPPVAA